MQKIITIFILGCLLSALLLTESCKKQKHSATPLSIGFPSHFPATSFYETTTITAEGAELGRRLFYDGRFSKDGSVSCASCHQQIAAFGTYDHDLSHGVGGAHSNRNAMSIFNIAWQKNFGWDGASPNLETVYTKHITNSLEMASTVNDVVNKINNDAQYANLTSKAFGSNKINSRQIVEALTQFLGTITSSSTKYDSVKQNLASFTTSEQNGYTIFKAKCNSCHTEPLFTDFSYRNIGLSLSVLNDKGRMTATGSKNDSLKFKVPTLRNLFKSYPFMHDGRFVSFADVFNHYQSGIVQSATLDPLLTNGIVLTQAERNAVIDFLKTLTDEKLVVDKRFSSPQ
jgi:cytochrome c peroxidase